MKCVYWHAESLVYPIGNATLFTAHKLASRRETAVPAFSPPDSPLFQFPVARNVCWYFPSITAPAVSRLYRLTSRLTARRQPPRITISRRGFAAAPFFFLRPTGAKNTPLFAEGVGCGEGKPSFLVKRGFPLPTSHLPFSGTAQAVSCLRFDGKIACNAPPEGVFFTKIRLTGLT